MVARRRNGRVKRKRGRLARRKSVRKLRRGRKSGVVTKRYGVTNPFGDKAMVKLRLNYAGLANGDGIGPTIIAQAVSVNDLSVMWPASQSMSKGFLTYPKLFRRYRVNGVMAKWTIFQTTDTGITPGEMPLMAFMQPYSEAEGNPTSTMRVASTLKQQRWTKWGYVRNWAQGGGPTTIKRYFSVRKMTGSDLTKTDMDYTAITDLSGNPYNSPELTWTLQTGVTSVSESALGVTVGIEYNLELTYYVEYFEQVREQQGL